MSEISLWKEQYKIGNEEIDSQHEELFRKIENLVSIARSGDFDNKKKECYKLIDFLVEYTGMHFEAEERIQREMQYVGYEQHVWVHREFTKTVLDYKEKLEQDFSLRTLKSFLGTLLTWLAVHVCGCDRKIMENIPLDDHSGLADAAGEIDAVITQFLKESYGLQVQNVKSCVYKGFVEGKLFIRTLVKGKEEYLFLYGLSEDIARKLYSSISNMQIADIQALDEMESSALSEIANIISTQIIGSLSKELITNYQYEDTIFFGQYTDETYHLRDGIVITIETEYGNMEVLYCKLK